MTRLSLFYLAFSVAVFLTAACERPSYANSEKKEVIEIYTGEYPPVTSGQDKGYYNKIVNRIFHDLGYSIRWKYIPYKRLNHNIKNEDFLISSSTPALFKNNSLFSVSDPIYRHNHVIISYKKRLVPNAEGLKGKKMVTILGMEPLVRGFQEMGASIHFIQSHENMYRMVRSGRVDGAIFDSFIAKATISRLYASERAAFKFSDIISNYEAAALIFRKKENPYHHLLEPFNKKLKQVIMGGYLTELMEEYVGKGNVDPSWIPIY